MGWWGGGEFCDWKRVLNLGRGGRALELDFEFGGAGGCWGGSLAGSWRLGLRGGLGLGLALVARAAVAG